jgi:hypothetical protein
VARPVDAPRKSLLSTTEACAWLGLGRDLFKAAVDRESDWLRPVWFGSGERRTPKWHWMDLVCLLHILRARKEIPPQAER